MKKRQNMDKYIYSRVIVIEGMREPPDGHTDANMYILHTVPGKVLDLRSNGRLTYIHLDEVHFYGV